MSKLYLAGDNGVTGSWGWIGRDNEYGLIRTPVLKTISYTKKVQFIQRIDHFKLREYITEIRSGIAGCEVTCGIERPYANPIGFKASMSAFRALESTIVSLEILGIGYRYLDSKEWQKVLLPSGLKGTNELKKASLEVGKRLYPNIDWDKFDDADGLLIAHYLKRSTDTT